MTAATYDRKHYYQGDKAAAYDASRIGAQSSPLARFRWQQEMQLIDRLAADWPRGSVVLDSPCGTGRFLPVIAKHGHQAIGADISADMLAQLKILSRVSHATPTPIKAASDNSKAATVRQRWALEPVGQLHIHDHHPNETTNDRRNTNRAYALRADIEQLPLRDSTVDIVLAIRVWSFLSDAARRASLSQWKRVARHRIYLQVRFRNLASDSLPVSAITSSKTCFDGRDCESIDPQQRGKWPTLNEFEEMITAASLSIATFHPLDWGPTDDPVMIAELIRRPCAK